MNTKERILYISLDLFSKHGFEGVSVREIAHEVGVRESALYKHYKNKQAILDSIIEFMHKRVSDSYHEIQVPEVMSEDYTGLYRKISLEHLCDISWKLFLLYTQDPIVSNYRKLLMREQFSSIAAAKQYNNTFLSGVIHSESHLFNTLVQGDVLKKEDPDMIALQFYGPIFFLFQMYDCDPSQLDVIKKYLFEHIKLFSTAFAKKKVH